MAEIFGPSHEPHLLLLLIMAQEVPFSFCEVTSQGLTY